MTLTELQTLMGQLLSDPNHDRYPTTDLIAELENSQAKWNLDAKVLSDTVTVTVVSGTRQYAISGLTGTPISFPRATHKGLDLRKRSKTWMDLYSGSDWTLDIGTPRYFFLEVNDPDTQYITLYPTPQGDDAGAYLVMEYIKMHTAMSAASDVPFMSGSSSNTLLRPYDWGLAYDASGRLLARDPSDANAKKQADYMKFSDNVFSQLIQNYKQIDTEEPKRIRGGRNW